MALDALLARLEGRAVTPVTADAIADVQANPAPMLACTPVTLVTAENGDTADKATSEPLSNPEMERRRNKALAMLAADPALRLAIVADDSSADPVRVAVARRGYSGEIEIPRVYYDPATLMELLDQHSAGMAP